MYSLVVVAGLALQTLAFSSAAVSDTSVASIVNLGYATYQGSTDPTSNITSFLGVRYGAPPTGE